MVAGNANWTTSVNGSTPAWLSVRGRSMAEGSFFTQQEMNDDDNVVVLGQTTAEELGLFSPVGETVDIGNIPFTIIGVLNSAGSSSSTNEDDLAVIPITTAQSEFLGTSSVSTIYLEAASQSTMGAADAEATDELLALHGITDPAAADFTITSQTTIENTLHLCRQDPYDPARWDRGDLAPGGRHRSDEHNARLGHRADQRDRPPKSARRDARHNPAPVPCGGL